MVSPVLELLLLSVLTAGCAALGGGAPGRTVAVAESPSEDERYCAWYGDARDGVLYFGQAAFWSGYRETDGDPKADLALEGPQLIGRFDLAAGKLLEPLDVTNRGARSGVWDVFAHENGRVYFTTFFESMGWVDPVTGEWGLFEGLGRGLNEIAAGPEGSLLVSRYATAGGGSGSVLVVSPQGELIAEHPIEPPAGYTAAPKTVAFDPARGEIWVTTDLLSRGGGSDRHDAYVLGPDGREKRRIATPEIHFVAFGDDGAGFRAEVDGAELWLERTAPDGSETRLLLDDGFVPELDFVQDIHPTGDGGAVLTRWSGLVHVVDPTGGVRSLRLPPLEPGALYYSGVLVGDRVCVTHCADVHVVCQELR